MNIPTIHSSLDDWLNYLEKLHSQTIDLGLDRIKAVADLLQLKQPNICIVVGGTNGKGSVCHILEAIYKSAGYTTGLYSSPHLIRFNERIHLLGQSCSDEQIIQALAYIEENRKGISLTYFEYTTLAALLIFSNANVDVAILEVGLGGRLDAVNIVDADCAVITSIDLDHEAYLGNTREKIAWEKAHIFRKGKVAICADPQPPSTLVDYAKNIGADLWQFGHDYNYSGDKQQWAFAGRYVRRSALPWPALRGANQLLNAAAALAAIEALRTKLAVPIQAIKEGLLNVNLPGRFQILPGQPTVILDVAHNPHAAAALAHNLDNMPFYPYTYAVVGMLKDKACAESLKHFGQRIDHWYCATLPGERGRSGQELAEILQQMYPQHKDGLPTIKSFASPKQAYLEALSKASDNDRIVVFGSFLTVADVLGEIDAHHG